MTNKEIIEGKDELYRLSMDMISKLTKIDINKVIEIKNKLYNKEGDYVHSII